ncbi:MAG: trypsin-like peptidase domain-containing protein [Labilithrix sp.]|nr:trypsin-like peptidase domain-containing protein [Labilithrix sp.]
MLVKSKAILISVLVPVLVTGCGRSKAEKEAEPVLPAGAVPAVASAGPAPTLNNGVPAPLPGALPESKDSRDFVGPRSFAPVAKSADPSVVTIYTLGEEQEPSFFSRGKRGARAAKGLGTGFIVQKDGVIVTNDHVIAGADEILVQLSDERRFPAKVAGRDPRTDIAVIRIEGGKDLPAIALGDSDALDVGDWVVAIGNPFGLSHTVSAGIVSAKGRGRDDVPLDPSGYYSFIQTDASINPGNSGGPLLNLKGEVVGMNSAIRGGGAQGIGFAIPINMVKQILPTLLREGRLTRSALGIRIRDARELSEEDRAHLKLGDEKGAVVEGVEPNGPADRAKLEVGDLIVAFDGQPTERSTLLQWMASTAGVGKTATLRVVRQGKPLDLSVTLGELKEPKRAVRPRPAPRGVDPEDDPFIR